MGLSRSRQEGLGMPNWKALIDEITAAGSSYDIVRRKYLAQLYEITGRNAIVYYLAWLQNANSCCKE